MGSEQSNPNTNQYILKRLSDEITNYINENIPKDSLRYHIFLMNANNFFLNEQFFRNVSIHKIADYINDLGFIDLNEAKLIVHQIIQISNCQEVATFNLQIVLPKMRVKFNDKYISPSLSQDLFKKVFSDSYDTNWGKYSPHSVIDWNSSEIAGNYLIQSQETLNQILGKMQQLCFYIKEKDPIQNIERLKYITCPVLHSEDLSSIIIMNNIDKLLEIQTQNFQGVLLTKKKIIKPMTWEKNIHKAAFIGDESSVIYCLHLLPILLNCPDENGNTPAHLAAIGDRSNIIKLLFSLGADFTIKNNDGHLPFQISGGRNVVLTFNSLEFDLNERDSNGESLLEIKTRDFNMDVIETLLKYNVNIFEPNPNGTYWMQFAIHGEFYKKKMDFINFQKRVRKIVSKNLKKEMEKEKLIKEILNRKVNNCDEEDTNDINICVTERKIDRLKVLLALGAHADRVRIDGKTNLMLCAERNDFEIADILASNFCDPNFKNKRGENTFWVASYLMNFDTANVLLSNGANTNEISSSGNTILHVAYEEKKFDVFKFLLDTKCDPNIKNKNKESVLFQAFYNKDDNIAELLQDEYNGDINTQTIDDNTLAHVALLEQDLERINYYITRGIDIEIKNSYGYSIFMISIIMFDNLQFSSTLLSYGADINTRDSNGNTALLNILHLKKFNKNKFDFLINNNCDINLQNIMGEFPISVCIIRELNDIAQFLLDKGCIINDNNTEFEPIANALKINSKYWFETLLGHGATVSNCKFPILSTYIKSKFFNFELMKKIKPINAVFGAPIQAALSKHYFDIALYIWNNSNEQTRLDIAATQDSLGMIPISAAIVYDCTEFVNILLRGNYEIMQPDLQNRTPFSYACQVNQVDWMKIIYQRISLQNANLVDNIGNSAFTYIACNNNKEFCKTLFLNDIDIFNINSDHNGIVDAYQRLLKKFMEFKNKISSRHDKALNDLQYYIGRISYWKSEISRTRLSLVVNDLRRSDDTFSLLLDAASTAIETAYLRKAENEYAIAVDKKNQAELIYNDYKNRFLQIKSMTRKDLFTNFNFYANLANFDESQNNNDINMFINNIFSIVEPLPDNL